MNPSSSSSLVASRDQALSAFNHPLSQSHSFPLPNFENGSFLSPINTQTKKPKTHTLFTSSMRFQAITGCLGERSTPAKTLGQILEPPGVHQGPACFEGLSAKLVERAGFQYCFTSGFSISASSGITGHGINFLWRNGGSGATNHSGEREWHQAPSLEESLLRSKAFADAGAEVLFIDALASKEEMKAFCEVFPLVPKMISNVLLKLYEVISIICIYT